MLELVCWHPDYIGNILNWKNVSYKKVGSLCRIETAQSYNLLIDINSIFSTFPKYDPVDRTSQAQSPYRTYVPRTWKIPTQQWTLSRALEQRVNAIALSGQKINMFWSGGVDSTTAVTAFLQHLENLSQLRILYSPYSTYEHPGYLDFLKKFPQVELVDISGEVYLYDQFDGVFITGDGGDEMNASLDQSYFDQYGYDHLSENWQDFFYEQTQDLSFVEKCQQHFSAAGRPIKTVLQARWWFYCSCKQRSILNHKLSWFFNYKNFDLTGLIGFFDCEEFENYIYWNIEHIVDKAGYHTWKQPLKDYCFAFDNQADWQKNKTKEHSTQMTSYLAKKLALNDQRYIGILTDGKTLKRISTPGLPVLTRREFEVNNQDRLDSLFL